MILATRSGRPDDLTVELVIDVDLETENLRQRGPM
jgi:hypothetical protein